MSEGYGPAAAASRRPGRHPSGAGLGGGGSVPWPGSAGAPRSDSVVSQDCSETAACRSTAARGSPGLWKKDTVIIWEEVVRNHLKLVQLKKKKIITGAISTVC